MGRTHYWYRPTELPARDFAASVVDVQRLLPLLNVLLAGFEGTGEPILTPDTIVFNGRPAGEPFEVHAVEFDRRGRAEAFGYCKSGGLPYDLAVKAALVVLKHHFGNQIRITSDESDDAWAEARQRVRLVLRYGDEFRLDPNEAG